MSLKLSLISILLLGASSTWAQESGFSVGGGFGKPNGLRGGRVSVIWDLGVPWFKDSPLKINKFLDLSLAAWFTDGEPSTGRYRDMAVVAVAPFFQFVLNQNWPVDPYLEASVGIALQSTSRLGQRDLGSVLHFQDFMGAGFYFGDQKRHSLSVHYLHYSNAGIWPPNVGVDVKGMVRWIYRH